MSDAVLRRVVRRETHSPRTAAAVVVLVAAALAAAYVGVEIALALSGADPLLVSPGHALAWLERLPSTRFAALGAVAALAGIVLIWLAASPGRRPKHAIGRASRAVLADNAVIASSLAERVRREMDLSPGAVVVGVGHRQADVTVRPEPGQQLERASVRAVAEAELDEYDLTPSVSVRVRVLRPGGEEAAR
ncbi:hypothetical protein [Microbacterium indicum]|uniref:hypothetical protein n=1 Tax=Microbacterium indicum TaxID=358100 RepID=UPI000490E980|nr:hypothetical protein [Microbacterium indicum]